MSQFYFNYPLTLVRWNNEVETAVLTFKSNTQNLQNIFPIFRTVMISDLKLHATNSKTDFIITICSWDVLEITCAQT